MGSAETMDTGSGATGGGPATLRLRVDELLPGVERVTDRGKCHEVVYRLADLVPAFFAHGKALAHALANPALLRRAGMAHAPAPGNVLCLDLETLGLQREPVFLVGLAGENAVGEMECRQLIARELDEEEAVLAASAEELERAHLVVTFNGTQFDIPYLCDRMRRYAIVPHVPAHVDVLLEARGRFGNTLPNCRLQTLEAAICGRVREGDVAGSEVPTAYRRFLLTGDARGIVEIARHNVLDLATTLELLVHLWGQWDA